MTNATLKSNTVKNIISRVLVTSLMGVFIIAFITSTILSYKSQQQQVNLDMKKKHALMSNLVSPSLVLSDTTEIRRLLSLASTSDEFFGIVNNENDILLSDYNKLNAIKSALQFNSKIANCNKIQGNAVYLNDRKYTLYCTNLKYQDIGYGINAADQKIGLLISFSYTQPLLVTGKQLFLYFIMIAVITSLLTVLIIRESLQKRIITPLELLKTKITHKSLDPTNNQTDLGNIGIAPRDILDIKQAFENLLVNLHNEITNRTESERKSALYDLAAQVAHDIRSPLAALGVAAKAISEIPEELRLLIRNATKRINDIANNLLRQTKEEETISEIVLNLNKPIKTEVLLMSMLDTLLSEKRAQYVDRDIQFELDIHENAHVLFTCLDPIELKRMISNIINNSVEAIKNNNGSIDIELCKRFNSAVIKISDNGCGIDPEDIARLTSRSKQISSSKKEGYGLGLRHAYALVDSCGGKIKINSCSGKGTIIAIELPLATAPVWFRDVINIHSTQKIIVLDDDPSIHRVWSKRFNHIMNVDQIEIKHFSSTQQFRNWINLNHSEITQYLFLIDYEIIGTNESGLDLIIEFGLQKESILITSRYEEQTIIERCKSTGVCLIPKSASAFIQIQLASKLTYDAVLTTSSSHD